VSALGREKRHHASTPPIKATTDSAPIIGPDLGRPPLQRVELNGGDEAPPSKEAEKVA